MARPRNVNRLPVPVRRVALVYSPIASGVPLLSAVERAQMRPGLGLRYLKAALQAQGVTVDLFDNLYDPIAADRVHERLNAGRYDLVGFHTTSASRGRALATIARLARPWYDGRVLAGGPGSMHADEMLASGVDVVAHGEGEDTIAQLLKAYVGEVPFDAIPGLSFQDEAGATVLTGPPRVTDLAKLPFPCWDDHDPAFGDMFNITLRRPFYVVMGSRGCPHRCSFCASHQHWRRSYRPRPVEHVLDEVQWLVDRHGARYIHFLDDIFGHAPGWADAFCDGMERRGIQVDFAVVLHPFTFRKDRARILARLKSVGCRLVSYGAQSADPDILEGIRRHRGEPDALREAIRITNELDLVSVLTFIFGLPGDTGQSLRKTIDFVHEIRPTVVDFHPLLYLPGSEIADRMDPSRYSRLTSEQINRWCMRAAFEYYILHGGGLRVLSYVARNNPGWFGNLVPIGRYAAEYLGLLVDRRDTRRFL